MYTQTNNHLQFGHPRYTQAIYKCNVLGQEDLCLYHSSDCIGKGGRTDYLSGTAGVNTIVQDGSLVTTCKWKLIRGKWKCKK